ncbi:MAG: sigma-70 family RNA polymerase sigma factor [Candidatus Hydrogenedentes bacterium]|nr:sigma-70 family RNA polymerase sigma factor [Candidatus Hydrogenedentota bacterium]
MISDATLIEESLSGNTKAFGALVERHKQLACALAYSATGDPIASEDIAQQAFIVAWRNLTKLESPGKLRPWLSAIIRNVAGDWLRRRSKEVQRSAALDQASLMSTWETPRDAAITRERQELTWEAVNALPEVYRVTLVLYYREGMSVQKVAEALLLTPDATKQRLARGRAMLRERLEGVVEDTLRRTGPRAGFAVAVLRALPAAPTAAAGVPKPLYTAWLTGAGVTAAAVAAVVVLSTVSAGGGHRSSVGAEPSPDVAVSPQAVANDEPAQPAAASAELVPEPTPATDKFPAAPPAEVTSALPPAYVAPTGYPGTDQESAPSDVISGVVYGASGKTIAGATVWICRLGDGARDTREVKTGLDGKYTMRVPRGSWRLRARMNDESGAATVFHSKGVLYANGQGDEIRREIRMHRQGTLRGLVMERESGRPIAGAQVWTDDDYLLTTDNDGRFTAEGLTPGPHCLYAMAPGRERRYVQYCTAFDSTGDLEISLGKAEKVRGRVVTPEGRPVAFAWVFRPASLWGAGNARYEVCDEQGRFTFDGIPAGKERPLNARVPAYYGICGDPYPEWKKAGVYESKSIDVREGEPAPVVTFVLRPEPVDEQVSREDWKDVAPTGAVCGTALSDYGKPMRNFRVMLQHPHAAGIASDQCNALEINSPEKGFSFTSEDGTFRLTTYDLVPGKFVRLVTTADGCGESAHDVVVVRPVGAHGDPSQLIFRIPKSHDLTIRVVDTIGAPLAAGVQLLDPLVLQQHREWFNGKLTGVRAKEADTDSAGVVRFEDFALSEGDITAEKSGYASARVTWSGEPEVRIQMQQACVVEGILNDESHHPLEEAVVALKRTNAPVWDYRSAEDDTYQRVVAPSDHGCVQIANLAPGRYELTIYGPHELMQWGIDAKGKPVKGYPADSRIFYQQIDLVAGQTYKFKCPDDSAHLSPAAWSARGDGETGDDTPSPIVGAWMASRVSQSGTVSYTIINYGKDGNYVTRSMTSGAQPFVQTGHFRIADGVLSQLSDRADVSNCEYTVSPDGTALTLREVGSEQAVAYQRRQSLESALAYVESQVGPPPPLPYTPLEPRPIPNTSRGTATFIPGEED